MVYFYQIYCWNSCITSISRTSYVEANFLLALIKKFNYIKRMRMFILGIIVTLCVVNSDLTKIMVVGVIDGIHCVYESTIGKLNNSAKS